MINPVLHTTTAREIELYLRSPAHAVALLGERGIGKRYVATHLATQLLKVTDDKLQSYPYFIAVEPDEKGVIGIEQARSMVSKLQLKTTGTNPVRRVVLIDQAETLTREAQNALLKAIEEPPADTVIICTIADRSTILPTVLSRLQVLTVHRPSAAELMQQFTTDGFDEVAVNQLLKMSGGLPGLTYALLTNQERHPLVAALNDAKVLLKSDSFDRLRQVDAIASSKRSGDIVQAIGYIADVALQTGATEAGVRRWSQIQAAAYDAAQQLAANANAKLVLTNLFLHV